MDVANDEVFQQSLRLAIQVSIHCILEIGLPVEDSDDCSVQRQWAGSNSGSPLTQFQMPFVCQVRLKLYKSAVGGWRKYQSQLAAMSRRLQPLIKAYEKAGAIAATAQPSATNTISSQHSEEL